MKRIILAVLIAIGFATVSFAQTADELGVPTIEKSELPAATHYGLFAHDGQVELVVKIEATGR